MTMPLILVLAMVVLYTCGIYLMLDRTLTRLLLGFLLVGNATNLMIFLMSGDFGAAPIAGESTPEEMSDPLPQAFILTAIVITFGVSAFLLALIYRSWRLAHDRDDAVLDDEADLEIATTEALTTVEVTDEDLEEADEFADDGETDGEDDGYDTVDLTADIIAARSMADADRRQASGDEDDPAETGDRYR